MTAACLLILATMSGFVLNDEPHIESIVIEAPVMSDKPCGWAIAEFYANRGWPAGLPKTYFSHATNVPIPVEKPKP